MAAYVGGYVREAAEYVRVAVSDHRNGDGVDSPLDDRLCFVGA